MGAYFLAVGSHKCGPLNTSVYGIMVHLLASLAPPLPLQPLDNLAAHFVVSGKPVHRTPGDKWMIRGPAEYIPTIQVGKIEKRCVVVGYKNIDPLPTELLMLMTLYQSNF